MLLEFRKPERTPAATQPADLRPVPEAFQPSLRTALQRLDRALAKPPCVVMLGESNSGKTSLVNEILGHALLPTSVVSNTRLPTLLRYDAEPSVKTVTAGGKVPVDAETLNGGAVAQFRSLEVGLPNERLRQFDLMDTPGHSGVSFLLGAAELTPMQLLVWCTVATQAWKECERRAWLSLPRSYRSQAILVATHADHLKHPAELEKVRERLTSMTCGLFKHVVFVAGGERSPDRDADEDPEHTARVHGITELEMRIREGVDAIRRKRYRAAERIVRRMARLARAGAASD